MVCALHCMNMRRRYPSPHLPWQARRAQPEPSRAVAGPGPRGGQRGQEQWVVLLGAV